MSNIIGRISKNRSPLGRPAALAHCRLRDNSALFEAYAAIPNEAKIAKFGSKKSRNINIENLESRL